MGSGSCSKETFELGRGGNVDRIFAPLAIHFGGAAIRASATRATEWKNSVILVKPSILVIPIKRVGKRQLAAAPEATRRARGDAVSSLGPCDEVLTFPGYPLGTGGRDASIPLAARGARHDHDSPKPKLRGLGPSSERLLGSLGMPRLGPRTRGYAADQRQRDPARVD